MPFMNTVKVKNVELGAGMPKIAIPIVGSDLASLRREIALVKTLPADLIEWRADYLDGFEHYDKVKQIAAEIRRLLPDRPILFTFRTAREGGEKEISAQHYVTLNHEMITSGLVDLVDVELFSGDETIREIIGTAHRYGTKVIMSNHEFHETPSVEVMLRRLCEMQYKGADVTKIAVMPKTATDVLNLLKVTDLMRSTFADRPFITMSMSGKGVITRLTGELFGSALSFGSAEKASAPGQVGAVQLAGLLRFFHEQSEQ